MADEDTKTEETAEAKAEETKEETPKEEPKKEEPKKEEPKKEEPKKEEKKEEPKEPSVELTKDAQKILDLVEKLSVLDLANLVKAMEEKFGVSAAAPVAVAAGGAAGGDDGADEGGGNVNVVLTAAGDQKIPVIKAVCEITGLGLKDAKAIVDAAPKAVKEDVPTEEADKIKETLEAVGASVEYK
jgi:large subunit ribosomal protein L7/L12